ncbi:hypothetical protein ESCO_002854 [Escovopsis weberi]|uniref:Uncharacterized protein n=1 Tax=Escovopsis weberi TaxID=150374 RepID=A0A0M8N093_ESCWE|nr:hypothetical protein ESCO_002854 [Escovopsis weberi]
MGDDVDPGREAPVAQEGAGPVAPESLAAESVRSGGAYAANMESGFGSGSEGISSREKMSEGPSAQHIEHAEGTGATQAEAEAAREQGAQAPTYVVDEYLQDRAGPHGRNITEDEMLGEGGEHGRTAGEGEGEVGSAGDPGREAERQFALRREMKGRSAGERQEELQTRTRYDILGSDRSAKRMYGFT